MTQKVATTEQDASILADPKEFAQTVLRVIGDDEINGQWVRMASAKSR
jgi:hypothetical protein